MKIEDFEQPVWKLNKGTWVDLRKDIFYILANYVYIYIYICVCVCVCVYLSIFIYSISIGICWGTAISSLMMGILGHAAEPRHEPDSLGRLRYFLDQQRPSIDVDLKVIYRQTDIQTVHIYMHTYKHIYIYLHKYSHTFLHAYITNAKDGV